VDRGQNRLSQSQNRLSQSQNQLSQFSEKVHTAFWLTQQTGSAEKWNSSKTGSAGFQKLAELVFKLAEPVFRKLNSNLEKYE
jgi:hypothetical protein